METYKIGSISQEDEGKILRILDNQKINYDYRCNGANRILFLKESASPKLLEYFNDNSIELLKEDVKEVPDIKNAALEGIVQSLYEWISADVSKEQIYSVIWALAMSREDESFNQAVLEIRNAVTADQSQEEAEMPTLKPQQDEPGRLLASVERKVGKKTSLKEMDEEADFIKVPREHTQKLKELFFSHHISYKTVSKGETDYIYFSSREVYDKAKPLFNNYFRNV